MNHLDEFRFRLISFVFVRLYFLLIVLDVLKIVLLVLEKYKIDR